MARTPVRAVLLDALGTLVELQPPAPRLRAGLLELAGVDVGGPAAARAFDAEIDHYLANHLRGCDGDGLNALRDECAAVMLTALEAPDLTRATVRRAMLRALEFRAFPDALPALRALRERGVRLAVVSNWDCSLPGWLDGAGLGGLFDAVVSSAVIGAAKPSPAVFLAALERVGATPEQALHVGDSVEQDLEGARDAGIRPILLVRGGRAPEGTEAIRSLRELPSLI